MQQDPSTTVVVAPDPPPSVVLYEKNKLWLMSLMAVAFFFALTVCILNGALGDDVSIDVYTVLNLISGLLILVCFFPAFYLLALEDLAFPLPPGSSPASHAPYG